MVTYQVVTTYADEPEQNREEIVSYTELIRIFPFISYVMDFNKLIITTDSVKYEIVKVVSYDRKEE